MLWDSWCLQNPDFLFLLLASYRIPFAITISSIRLGIDLNNLMSR